MDVKLCDQVISILIEPGSNYNYASPDLVDTCCLSKELHVEAWLVQLATCIKKRVHHWVRACACDLSGIPTATHLKVLLLGMDWLYIHRTKVECYDKSIECVDDNGEPRVLQAKNKSHQLGW